MTTYRILPDGRRRRAGAGNVRAVGQAGDIGTALAPATMQTGWELSAQISFDEAGQQVILVTGWTMSAQLSADAPMQPTAMETGWTFSARAYGAISASAAVMETGWVMDPVRISLTAPMTPAPMETGWELSARISINAAEQFRSKWLDSYARRQEVLNAIDANNRFLAHQAGEAAEAVADALIITNTQVLALGDGFTTLSERYTLLSTRVDGVETSTGEALSSMLTTITAIGDQTTINSSAITAVNAAMEGKASQSSVNALTSTVSSQGEILTLHGSSILSIQGELAGKASASALAALTTTVTQHGNDISSLSTAVTAVSASVGDTPGNLVRKSTFADMTTGQWANAVVGTAPSSGWGSQPTTTYRGPYLTTTAGGTYETVWFPVSPGEVLEVSANLFGTANATGGLGVQFQDASSGNTNTTVAASSTAGVWEARAGTVTVPAGAVRARAWLNAGSGGNNIRMTQPRIAKQAVTAAQQASAIETLTASAAINTSGVATLNARHSIALNVDGHISGTESVNDGKKSVFTVLASVFRVISSGTAGMEWQNGYLRIYLASAQLILGHSFGTSNDLVMWYGPNVGAANATKATGVFWLDKTGGAYFGGSLAAGTLSTQGRFNFTGLTPGPDTQGVLVHANSSGRPKSIIFTPTYGVDATTSFATKSEADAFVASRKPDRTGTVTFRLRRGATSIWSGPVTATSYANPPEYLDTIPPAWFVQYGHRLSTTTTFPDTSAGTGDIIYTAEIVSSSGAFFASAGSYFISVIESA